MKESYPETASEVEAQRMLDLALECSYAEIEEPVTAANPAIRLPEGSTTFMIAQEVNGEIVKIRPYFLPGGELEIVSVSYGNNISVFKEPSETKKFMFEDIWETICKTTFGERKKTP